MSNLNKLINEHDQFLTNIKNNPNRYMDFLSTMAKFHKYPLMQQINLYFHAPAAAPAVASKHILNDVLHWQLEEDAPIIEILNTTPEGTTIEHVYDIRNTRHYKELSEKDIEQIIWKYNHDKHQKIVDKLFPGEGELSQRILDTFTKEINIYNEQNGNTITDPEFLALTSTYITLERLGYNAEEEIGMQFIMHTWQDFNAAMLLDMAKSFATDKLKRIEAYIKTDNLEKEQDNERNKSNSNRERFSGRVGNSKDEVSAKPKTRVLAENDRAGDSTSISGELPGGIPDEIQPDSKSANENEPDSGITTGGDELAGISESHNDGGRDSQGANPEGDLRDGLVPQDISLAEFDFTADMSTTAGKRAVFNINLAAIKLAKKLEAEGRQALANEKELLKNYRGFGGISEAFDEYNSAWKKEYNDLRDTLTHDEYNSARDSVLNAHYTSPEIIQAIFAAVKQMGFNGGNILEPAVGSGRFFESMPEDMKSNSNLVGIELDSISSKIAAYAHPEAQILNKGFEESGFANDSFDLAISNVPFGDYKIKSDLAYRDKNMMIHDYFIAKMIDQVRPGGIVAAITSSGTMDKANNKAREYMTEKADIVGAFRLPITAFKSAGTDVTTDIIFFRKKDPVNDLLISPNTASDNRAFSNAFTYYQSTNSYYSHDSHFDHIMGKMNTRRGKFGPEHFCEDTLDKPIHEALNEIFAEEIPADIYTPSPNTSIPVENIKPAENAVGFFYENEHIVFYDGNGNKVSLELTANEVQHILAAMHIRDAARKLIAGQRNYCSNEELAIMQKELNRCYEDYVDKYGRIQLDNKLKKIMENEPSYPLLRSLEVFDHKVFSRKADIFYQRTINPDSRPSYVETSEDALKLSMNYKGCVDIQYMSELTGSSQNEIIDDLEFSSVYYNPETDNYQLADEYLSGNILDKIEKAEIAIKNLQQKQLELTIQSVFPNWDKFEFIPQNPIEKKIYHHVMLGGTNNNLPKECYEYLHQNYDNLELMALATSKGLISMPREKEEENHNKLRIELLKFKLDQPLVSKYFYHIFLDLYNTNTLRTYFFANKNIEQDINKEEAAIFYNYLAKKMTDWPEDEAHDKIIKSLFLNSDEEKKIKNDTNDFDEFVQTYKNRKAAFIASDPDYLKIEEDIQKLRKNIAALEDARPTELKPGEIAVRLGSTWLKPSYIKDFLVDELEIPSYEAEELTVEFSQMTGEWKIGRRAIGEYNTKINDVYGTSDKNALELCELALNLKEANVYNVVHIDGKEKRRINPKATMAARIKQQSLKEVFQKWIWKDPERSREICSYYNRHFNNIKPREYNGDFLTFPGMSSDIKMQKHQRDAIAHTLYGGNTLLAHCVGAGKSFEMIASAMESKRLGLAKKPMLVVPKHLTEQMGEDFHRLYPAAKILIATDKTFTAQNRKELCSKIATQNWDAVIMGYTQFEKIPLSLERQKITLQEQINEITEAAEEYTESTGRGKSFTVKQMAKMRKKLEAKLASLQKEGKDETVTFEDLGVDKLYVDEAHYFKNLYTPTKLGNISGIQTTEAAKTMDFYQKCKYINEITNYHGLVFATGTPISNSMTEMYTMQRYLQPQRLAETGMGYFDAWAANFGEQVTDLEINPEGKGFRERTKFSQFQNLPELMANFKEIADIKTADMLNLPVPKEEIIVEKIKPTDLQKDYVDQLADRAEQVRAGEVDVTEDNMLKITNEGRLLALDQRIIIPNAPDNPESKTNRCIANVMKIYRDGTNDKATQLIFCDKSTPNKDGKFNVYDDIKEKLIQQGVPAQEIAFIHDAKTDNQRDELFEQVRQGRVRILLGSTDKLGVGTNIQDRLAATHDLDVPWRPSDLEQRKGRICRRGNQNDSVKIFRYVTEGTFDAYMWQILENKQRYISQIMTSKAPARTSEDCDELTLSFAEVKACATGNPIIKEQMELDNEIKRLEIAKSNYLMSHEKLKHKCNIEYPIQIKSLESLIAKMQDMKTQVNNNTVKIQDKAGQEKELFSMEINGKQYINPVEANTAIIEASKGEIQKVSGRYKGLALTLERDLMTGDVKIVLSHKSRKECNIVTNGDTANIQAINKLLNSLSDDIKHQKNRLESLKKDCETIKQELLKPFDKEEILKEKLQKREALALESQVLLEGRGEMYRRIQALENVLDSNGNIIPSKLPDDELAAACTAHAAYIFKSSGNNWPEDGNFQLFSKLAEQYEVTAHSYDKYDAFDIQEIIQEISPNLPIAEDMAHIIDQYYDSEKKVATAEYQMETKQYHSPAVAYAR